MGVIAAGTSSWNDQGLLESGLFYPPDIETPLGRLRHYAERFPVTELDSSFHLLPTVRSSLQLADHTPASFSFDVSAYRLLTDHPTGPGALPHDIRSALGHADERSVRYDDLPREVREELWQRFFLGIEPLRRAGKLGAVILQFPLSFVPSAANFDRLAGYAERLKGYTVALEFSHRAWTQEDRLDRTWEVERKHGFAHVIADEPDRPASADASHWAATNAELAIVRAYGPNRVARESKAGPAAGASANHCYNEEQLKELAARVLRLTQQAKNVHVLFANIHRDCAQKNAAQLRLILNWMGG